MKSIRLLFTFLLLSCSIIGYALSSIQEVGGLKYEWGSKRGGGGNLGTAYLVGRTRVFANLVVPYSIEWPAGVNKGHEVKIVSIGSRAFANDTTLKSIEFSSVSFIDHSCFIGCTSLSEIHVNMTTPPNFYEDAFDDNQYDNTVIYVPEGTIEKYWNSGWNRFKNITDGSGVIRHRLNVISSGNGNVSFKGIDIRENNHLFEIIDGSSATISITPDAGYRVSSVYLDNTDITSNIVNNECTLNNIKTNTTLNVTFEAITYSLSITAVGNGSAKYNNTIIKGNVQSFLVNEGASASITLMPDNGYRIASIKVNNIDETTSIINDTYTINNITANTTITINFEAITYNLSIIASDYGSVIINNTAIRNKADIISVNKGATVTISFMPDKNHRIGTVKLNNKDITSELVNNQYTISNVSSNNNLEVEFEPIIRSLTIKATGCGSATFNNTEIRDKSSSFAVNEGTSATIAFNTDAGYRIKTVKLNDTNVTSSIVNSQYTISNISSDNTLEVEFEKSTYMLNIKSTGNGTTIYNSTSIRNQGNSFTVDEGTTAVVTFSPDAGYRIKSVIINGADVTAFVSNSHYTVSNISANTTIEVEYDAIPIASYSLNISATGNGTITYNGTTIRGKSQAFTVDEGASATVTFTPDDGYKISSVKVNDVDVTSNIANNLYTISNISGNTTLKVVFEPITHSLSITASGNGSASYNSTAVRGKTQTFTVNEGTSAIVSFTPDAGYRIASVKVNNSDVTANVANNQYNISNITANTTLSVTFEAITHSLSITASGNGSAGFNSTTIRNKTEVFTINEGTSATVTFTPDAGYKIKSVKQNGTDVTSSVSESQYTISNISSDITLEVAFEAITHTLNITASGNGSATYNSTAVRDKTQTFTVNEGTSATITFTPDAGYRIASVKVNNTDVTANVVSNKYTISNITANTTLSVAFEAITHSLSITASGNGSATYSSTTVRGKTQTFTVNEGTSAVVKFTPDTGYKLKSVKLNGTDVTASVSNSQYTISNISSDTTLEVVFEAITHTLSITASGNGSATYNSTAVRGKTQTFTVNEGTSATITFTPDAGYRIVSVKVNNTDVTANVVSNKYTISNITANTSLSVAFEAITHTLSITASGNGSVTYNSTAVRGKTQTFSINEGTSAVVKFTPDTGYKLKSVKLNGTDVTASVSNSQYTISNINSDTTLEVVFEGITHTLSITASGNGSANYNSTAVRGKTQAFTVNEGSSATITFAPDAGYRIASVKVNNTDVTADVVSNKYTINNITANTSLSVEFEAITHKLSITASGNGSATYGSTTVRGKTQAFTVNEGTSATITFAPDAGFRIASVKVNNTDVTASVVNERYTISNISANTTLTVAFEAIPPTTYALSITAIGNGYATYNGNTVRGRTSTFSVVEGNNAVLKFSADEGNRLKSVKVNGQDVMAAITNSQYTISNITTTTVVEVTFEVIPSYTLNIAAVGNGSASYNETTIRNQSQNFTLREGSSASITLTADEGYRVKSVTVNNEDWTSQVVDGQVFISNIMQNMNVEVAFEAIPPTTYSLSITAKGNGTVTYDGQTLREGTSAFTVVEGSYATIQMAADDGYRLKSVVQDGRDVTASVSNGRYTTGKIMSNTSLTVEFEAIPTYTLTIQSTAFGSVKYGDVVITNRTEAFTVREGSQAMLTFAADGNGRLIRVTLNGGDITPSLTNGQYTISDIRTDQTVVVEYAEDITKLLEGGVAYSVTSYDEGSVVVAPGNYGQVLTVPASFEAKGKTWTVTGIADDALAGNSTLAAVIWEPEVRFTAEVTNPNLLLYVTQAEYAPEAIQNVVVGDTERPETLMAESIVLTDAAEGNDFYCPRAFTTRRITYEHNYGMTTGYHETQGWETIVLPFDVTTVLNRRGTELAAYATWQHGSNQRPYWLYQLTGQGWQAADGIKANTPYIISMPNNPVYESSYNQTGYIQFVGNNAVVAASDQMVTSQNGSKQLVANYQTQAANSDIYALNVSNLWSTNTDTAKEGSTFIRNLRTIHPFEAYLTLEGNNAPRAIGIFDGATGVNEELRMKNEEFATAAGWYDLQGRRLYGEPKRKGVYISKGKKVKR